MASGQRPSNAGRVLELEDVRPEHEGHCRPPGRPRLHVAGAGSATRTTAARNGRVARIPSATLDAAPVVCRPQGLGPGTASFEPTSANARAVHQHLLRHSCLGPGVCQGR